MKKQIKKLIAVLLFSLFICVFAGLTAFAADSKETAADSASVTSSETSEDISTGTKAMAAALCVGLAAAAGAVGMALAISKSAEGISRQPEAEGKIRTTLMLGLVFIETAIIYALIVAILIIFVL